MFCFISWHLITNEVIDLCFYGVAWLFVIVTKGVGEIEYCNIVTEWWIHYDKVFSKEAWILQIILKLDMIALFDICFVKANAWSECCGFPCFLVIKHGWCHILINISYKRATSSVLSVVVCWWYLCHVCGERCGDGGCVNEWRVTRATS